MKLFAITFTFLFCANFLNSQELNCRININSEQIQGTNKSVFNTLQKSLTEFVNNRKWTDQTYSTNEKIDCTFNIVVKKVDGDQFSTELTIQSRRPVFNTSYSTPLFNFKDQDFNFTYKEFDPIEMNEVSFTSNLTAVLAYYSYLIIGFDMDSYSAFGGTSAFQQAENIVNSAQSANQAGWKAFENNRNRYALINNILDEVFKKYRKYFYDYHRLGLDEMATNTVNARTKIADGLPILREANRARPSTIIIATFLETKNEELINIFSKATAEEKKLAYQILCDVNPTLTNKYERILK